MLAKEDTTQPVPENPSPTCAVAPAFKKKFREESFPLVGKKTL